VTPSWSSRTLRILVAGTAVWLVAGIAAGLLTSAYHLIFGAEATHAFCATLRTLVLSAAALLLAWAGSRWDRPEFGRLVYPVMALGAYRMIVVDLQQDRTAALFLSLLLYGGALILLPKLIRARAVAQSS
jgi:predicted Co/Zn/Cd cation transporter (cation efflux family)